MGARQIPQSDASELTINPIFHPAAKWRLVVQQFWKEWSVNSTTGDGHCQQYHCGS
ncbi:hypothetical protein QBD00_001376 [Ochrobactrum sp. AN78]|nr:hypothetical protein [Ochrobactrum sp. AN78]